MVQRMWLRASGIRPRGQAVMFHWIALTLLAALSWSPLSVTAYDGLEGKTRFPTPVPPDLSPQEQATIAIFEKASRSVAFIANTAIQRDPWSFNVLEVPQGSGTGFVWDKRGHVVTNFHVVYQADSITVTLSTGA